MDLQSFLYPVDDRPKLYFETETCRELAQLVPVASVLAETLTNRYNDSGIADLGEHVELIEGTPGAMSAENWAETQLVETDPYNSYFDACEEVALFGDIRPANRPYDFNWGTAHLKLYHGAKLLIGAAELNPETSFSGSICLVHPEPEHSGEEVVCLFRLLKESLLKVETVHRQASGQIMPNLTDLIP